MTATEIDPRTSPNGCGHSDAELEIKPDAAITTQWVVDIQSINGWVTFAAGFQSRSEAETAVGRWKWKNDFRSDPFRYRQICSLISA